MARRQVLVQLDDELIARLDHVTDALHASRSELIRRAIDAYLDALDEAVADVRYAQAYQRIPDDLRELKAWEASQLETWP